MEEVVRFLASVPPWADLPAQALGDLAARMAIEYFPRGRHLLTAGDPSTFLFVLRSGSVELRSPVTAGGGLLDRLDPGDFFDAPSVVSGTPPAFDAVAREDTLVYLLPRAALLPMLRHPSFERDLVSGPGNRLRHAEAAGVRPGAREAFDLPIGDLVVRPLVACPPDLPIRAVAARMREAGVSSVVVASEPPGIVTDRDLRDKVLVGGIDPDLPVGTIANRPLATLSVEALGFEALLLMLERHIHHLPVTRSGRIVGLITSTDLLRRQSRSPLLLPRMLDHATSEADFPAYVREVVSTATALHRDGARATAIGRVVAHAQDALVRRLLASAFDELGAPPAAWCWVSLGSWGRMEEPLPTRQESALVFADDAPAEAGDYFRTLAERIVARLDACGFPRNGDGLFTAADAAGRGSVGAWKQAFGAALEGLAAPDVALLAAWLDGRRIAGPLDPQDAFRPELDRMFDDARLDACLVDAALAPQAPLALSPAGFIEPDGRVNPDVDLESRCIRPLVAIARRVAVRSRSFSTGTQERLRQASDDSGLDGTVARDLAAAHEWLSAWSLDRRFSAETPDSPDRRGLFRDVLRTMSLARETLARGPGPGGPP